LDRLVNQLGDLDTSLCVHQPTTHCFHPLTHPPTAATHLLTHPPTVSTHTDPPTASTHPLLPPSHSSYTHCPPTPHPRFHPLLPHCSHPSTPTLSVDCTRKPTVRACGHPLSHACTSTHVYIAATASPCPVYAHVYARDKFARLTSAGVVCPAQRFIQLTLASHTGLTLPITPTQKHSHAHTHTHTLSHTKNHRQ
jgi:hypothetical protein